MQRVREAAAAAASSKKSYYNVYIIRKWNVAEKNKISADGLC